MRPEIGPGGTIGGAMTYCVFVISLFEVKVEVEVKAEVKAEFKVKAEVKPYTKIAQLIISTV